MFYLLAYWIDETDYDLFKFKSFDLAIEYIQEEGITDFTLSTRAGLPEQDYTLIEDVPEEAKNGVE